MLVVVKMATGRVIQFNETRGYGFIAPDVGGDDVFVHAEQVKACGGTVRPGTRVNFKVIAGQRGDKAYAVEILDPPPSGGEGALGGALAGAAAPASVERALDGPGDELSE